MFVRFKQRSYELERLDTGDYTPAEYVRWQREMRVVHRVFGENRAVRRALLPEIARVGNKVSILDVGAGSGELLNTVHTWNISPQPFLVGAEINSEAARSIRDRAISAVQCDGLQLPFADNSFDFVICSLFLHHLTDDKVIELLAEMRRVARNQIFAIDLHRSPLAYCFYRIVGSFFLQRFTVEDGSLSILRAFKPKELESLGRAAGLKQLSVLRSAAYRLVLSGK